MLEARFSLFLRLAYQIARRSLPQKFTLSALAGKLARQVLEVTLAKARFCFALLTLCKYCGDTDFEIQFC